MTNLIVVFALAAGVSACSSSPFSTAPTSAGPYSNQYNPAVPRSQYECMTDDGYGRSRPCNAQD